MKIKVLEGKYFRKFLHIYDIVSVEDLEFLKKIKDIVTRTEYKPFIKSFNKNVTRTFLFENNLIPAQFYGDLHNKLLKYYPEIIIENKELLINQNFSEEYFEEWLEGINLPKGFTVTSPEYIYQKDSVIELIKHKYGRIEIGTGGGKTLIMYLCIKYLLDNELRKITDGNNKVLVLIDRVSLILQTKREWEEKFDSINIINGNNYSVPLLIESIHTNPNKLIGANVIIATWNSISNYDIDWFSQFKVIISDEAHKSKAYSIETLIYNKLINMEYSFGFTGTWQPYPTLDYLSNTSMFGTLVYTKKTYDLIQDENVCKVKVIRVNINYSDMEHNYISEMKKRYTDELTGIDIYHLECNWIQNHLHRNMLIVKFIKKFKNNHLILVRNVSYLEYLVNLIERECSDRKVLVIHGNIPISERETIQQIMEKESNIVLVATNDTMSTGISINNLWYVHNPDGGKSRTTLLQGLGRGLRKYEGKEYAYYFDYNDILKNSSYNKQAKVRLEYLKEEKHIILDVDVKIDEYQNI